MRIRVVESGEEADYKMTEISNDPREHRYSSSRST